MAVATISVSGVSSLVNGVNTTVTTAGATGNGFGLMAFSGNVYIISASGALTLS
jgi:hypothetical protein